ncbi:MAG: AAA family ATPase [Ktedonobacteraceae bacterium]
MLTQIEIDGFKTFKDFKVELAPFQVIVGPNGSGKSNLFDALQLLSRLAEVDLRAAFEPSYGNPQKQRGDTYELFTRLPNGHRSDRIKIAVEMLVDRKVKDDLGSETELAYIRLRYELEIILRTGELDQLNVTHESLQSIPLEKDNWCKKYGLSHQNGWLPKSSEEQAKFITTELAPVANFGAPSSPLNIVMKALMIQLHHEGQEITRMFRAEDIQRTVLSSITNAEYPHPFAVRQEMRSWKFLHLSYEALRQPGPANGPSFISIDGSNLPSMLARMQREDKFALNDVSRDLANLVPDAVGVELTKDDILNRYTVWVKYMDERSFPSSVLSDGTLRLLALAALRNDPQFHGVLCMEEPENGVHPSTLKDIAHMLRRVATDFSDPEQVNEPLNQMLVTTHSPTFISLPDVIDKLLFANSVTLVEPGEYTIQITQMRPVVTSNSEAQLDPNTDTDETMDVYTIDQVIKYLDSQYLNEAHEQIDKVRTKMNEG